MSSERPTAERGCHLRLVDVESDVSPPARRSSPVDDYVPGQMIAEKYELLRRLGEGGMASVWVAHNEALDIDVAVKFIRADIDNGLLGARLLQEARAAARLGHPAIVRVSDYGNTVRGDPYIVMELLDGEDLGMVIDKRGRMPAVKAVRTLLPVAHALASAHEKGIVHRDLKPDNVFLVRNDDGSVQPKLVDFGIAKLENQGSARLTDFGSAMGSPSYMSPEQARGLDVDHRADIWAFCVVIYEMVTGRPPFEASSYNALLRSIVEDGAVPITNWAAGDDELWAILEKGLDKDIEQRWQSMRELGTALAEWLVGQGVAEDVVGASLQATWIQWKRQFESSPPPRPSRERQEDVTATISEPSRPGSSSSSSPGRVARVAAGVALVLLVLISGLLVLRAKRVTANEAVMPPPVSTSLPSASAIATPPTTRTTKSEPSATPTSEAAAKPPPTRVNKPAPVPTRERPAEKSTLKLKTTF